MKSSIFRFVLFALSACLIALYHAINPVAQAVLAVGKAVLGVVLDACALAKPESETRTPSMLWMIEAKSFVSRIEKRERPVLTDSWRMCPSV